MDSTVPVALVNSDSPPYWMDTVDILFAPEGYDYSSRYQWEWVNEAVDPKKLKGRRVLLILLGRAADREYYLPLREATVSEVSDYGPFLVIKYRLGPFVDLTTSPHDFSTDFDKRLRTTLGITDEITDHTGHLVFPLKDITVKFSTKEVDDDHNWANMVKEVARSRSSASQSFFAFMG